MTDGIQLDRCHPGKFRIHVSSSSELHLIKETFASFIKFLGGLFMGKKVVLVVFQMFTVFQAVWKL